MLSSSSAAPQQRDPRRHEILAAQVRLLYSNANVGLIVTLLATIILGRLEWGIVRGSLVLGWSLYMVVVALSRYVLARLYQRESPECTEVARWRSAFTVGAGLAGLGWGGGGALLYPE